MSAGVRSKALLEAARAAKGFMPDDEGVALARLAGTVESGGGTVESGGGTVESGGGTVESGGGGDRAEPRVVVEVGAYCGRSTLYLAAGIAAAAEHDGRPPRTVVFSVDHHHGSEENQAGWEHHDVSLVDHRTGRMDTLPTWRATIGDAGAEDLVVALVGDSPAIAARWPSGASLVFIDGGHGTEPAWADYRGWAPRVATGAWLAIHDVYPDPADGGRPPYELYCRALESGAFEEAGELGLGSLRVLRRIGPGH